MPQKFALEEIQDSLRQAELPDEKITEVITDLQRRGEEIAEDTADEASGREKWQYVVLINNAEGVIPDNVPAMYGWVVKIPESATPMDAKTRAISAGQDFNMSPKGRRVPVRNVGEALQNVGRKIMREGHGLQVQTKEAVVCMVINGTEPISTNASVRVGD